MNTENTKHAAFPLYVTGEQQQADDLLNTGLTKREYFAAMAMQALVNAYPPKLNISENSWTNIDIISTASIKLADELLKQLTDGD